MEPVVGAMDTILSFLASFVDAMLEIGGSVIEFIMTPANAICLIPVVAWLVVMGVGLVRSLYRG